MKLSHSKLGSTAASIVLAAVSTLLTALPSHSQADGYRIGFSNGCHSATIRVAVSWYDANSGEWIDRGWYELSPGERTLFNGPLTKNRRFYYYAESTDGSKKWGSNDQPALVVNGRSYIPRRVDADFSNGSNYIHNLICTGEAPIETTPEVFVKRRQNIGAGWAEGRATLYRSGLLVIEGQARSRKNTSATRATINVVGLDRKGNVLFVSEHLDIPTACGRWDTCPHDRTGRKNDTISPEIAKFVHRLKIHISDRGGRDFWESTTRVIRKSCGTYDKLPAAARAAIAAETGFPGCNP